MLLAKTHHEQNETEGKNKKTQSREGSEKGGGSGESWKKGRGICDITKE